MANRKAPSGGRKPAGKSGSGSRSGGGGGAKGSGKGGFSFAKLILYPLAIAGGGYIGLQVYESQGGRPIRLDPAAFFPQQAKESDRRREVADSRERPGRDRRRREERDRRTGRERPEPGAAERDSDRGERERREREKPEPAVDTRGMPEPAAGDLGPTAGDTKSSVPGTGGRDGSRPGPQSSPILPANPDPSSPEPAKVEVRPVPPTASSSTSIRPLPPKEIERGNPRRREVALTFDAGSDYRPVRKILDTLSAGGVKCTFFLTGEWVQRNPKTARLIADSGHEIGNHSWDHPPFTKLSDIAIQEQLNRTDEIIQEVTGRSSRPFFRPPLGARDQRVRKVVGDTGFYTVYWTLDSRDSVDRGITAEQIRDRVLGKIDSGSIVLMHCGSQASADALPEILRDLKSRGLTPVPVGRLVAD